jgi:hypothetical protein
LNRAASRDLVLDGAVVGIVRGGGQHETAQVVRAPVGVPMLQYVVGPLAKICGLDRRPTLARRRLGAAAATPTREHVDPEVALTAHPVAVAGRNARLEPE